LINNKNCPFLIDMTLEPEANTRGASRQWAATAGAKRQTAAMRQFKKLADGYVVDYDR
jgi:hypothetical protein